MTRAALRLFCFLLFGASLVTAQNGGPPGGDVLVLEIAPSNPNVMYSGILVQDFYDFTSRSGLFRSSDHGQTWVSVGSGLPDDRLNSLAVDTLTSSVVYAGTMNNGVFKSLDGGVTWASVNAGFTDNWVSVLAVDPSSPATLYAGTNGASGLFRTTNSGQSWTPVPGFAGLAPVSILFDPANRQTIYVGTSNTNSVISGLYKSIDGGVTWTLMSNGISEPPVGRSVPVTGIAVDPTNPNIVYVAGGSVFKSVNGGQSWNLVGLDLGITRVFVNPAQPSTLYGAGSRGFFTSTDGGNSWSASNSGLTDFRLHSLALSPENASLIYAATSNDGVFQSSDGGQTWTQSATGLNARAIPALALDPANASVLYAASAGSLLKSTDAGYSWTLLNAIDPMHKPEAWGGFLTVSVSPDDSSTVYAGGLLSDTGNLLKSTDAGQSWIPANMPFLPLSIAINPLAASTLYAGSNGSGVLESTDAGQTWAVTPLNFGRTITSVVLDANNPSTIYAGSIGPNGGLLKSGDGGDSWTSILNAQVMSIAVTLVPGSAGTTVYAGSMAGDIAKSTDSGASWSFVQSGIVDGSGAAVSVRTVAVDPNNSNTVYAGTFGAGVLKSTDGGQTWNLINAGLPNLRIPCLVVDPANPATIYAATSGAGVFKSTDGGQSWQGSGTQPPAPAIAVSPTQIAFPPTLINTRSAAVTVTVSNPGTATLLISDISTQSPFAIVNFSPNITTGIPPNTSGTFDVVISATAASSYSGTVSITSNASALAKSIAVTGVVLDPNNSLTTSIFVVSNIKNASFSIVGPIALAGTGQVSFFSNIPTGTYSITYVDVAGFIKPPVQTLTLQAGTTLNFVGNYRRLIFVAFPGLGTSAANAAEGMATLVCETTGNFPRNPASCTPGTTIVPATVGNTFDWDAPDSGAGSPTEFITSNLESPEDPVAIVGHSYGGDRTRVFAKVFRSSQGMTPDYVVTIDPIDPKICKPAYMNQFLQFGCLLSQLSPCDQSGTYYDVPPGVPASANFVQRSILGVQACVQGYNLLGVNSTLVPNVEHRTIDNDLSVHNSIREQFASLINSPKFVRFSISNVRVSNIKSTSAVVSWNTNQPVGTLLEWGLRSAYGVVSYSPILFSAHSVSISGLKPATTYHFRVISPVTSNQKATTNDSTFMTLP